MKRSFVGENDRDVILTMEVFYLVGIHLRLTDALIVL